MDYPNIVLPISIVNRHPDRPIEYISGMGRDAVGVRLRYARKLRKLTQQGLAELSSVAQAIISETETGESRSPSGPNLVALAQALQVTPQWLAHNKGPMETLKPTIPSQGAPALSPEAVKVAMNWSKLAPEIGKRIADMLEEMVKVSSTAPEAETASSRSVKRARKST